MRSQSKPKMNKGTKIIIYYLIGSLILGTIGLIYWIFVARLDAYTDDAYVEGNQVSITPLKSGFVTAIHTDDTYLVEKGQLLIQLDTTDAEIELESTKKNLAQVVRTVCELYHEVFSLQSEIFVKKAEWVKAMQDFQHRKGVIDAGGVSVEDFEHAIAALQSSYYSLQQAESLYSKALALVQNTTLKNHPQILSAAEKVRFAFVQLYRCNIYSPVKGLAAQRKIQVGMWVSSGDPLLSIIPLDQIWVNANYKETQLKKARIGQKVRLTSDLYGKDVVYHGKIAGLPGGAGNAFSLLPPQNLSGNWIKIVQRLPVRVELDKDELKAHPLRIGLSMEATIDYHDEEGKLVPSSTYGSPSYETQIYKKEEAGDVSLIESIILENLDPSLSDYLNTPLVLKPIHTSLPIEMRPICNL